MAMQDNLAYMYYMSQGGKLSFTDWINAGKPAAGGNIPGTQNPPLSPPSPNVSGSVTPPQTPPLTPGDKVWEPGQGWVAYSPPPPTTPKAVEDTIDADIAAAAAAAEKEAKDRKDAEDKKAKENDFTNPTKQPSTPPPPGFKWGWDGFRWQPKEVETKGEQADPELSNPRKMPSSPPPPNHHWGWNGSQSQWQPVKDEVTTEKTPKGGYATPEEAEKARQDSGNPDWYTVEPAAGTNGVYYYLNNSSTYGKKKKEKDYNYVGDTYLDINGKGYRWDDYEGYKRDTSLDKDEGSFESDDEKRAAAERAAKAEEDKRRYEADTAEAKRQYEAEQKSQSEDVAFRQQQATQSSDQFWKQFDYQKSQDAARMQAEKEQRLANLRQSPASWLQYSLEANQTPVIQPWQKPLMPQQYGNLNVGQPIPGWQGLNQGSANLPELTTPSTQYFARIGPTAQQQWGGYQQMQSGAPIDESMFRLQSQSAPGGRNQGLSWLR